MVGKAQKGCRPVVQMCAAEQNQGRDIGVAPGTAVDPCCAYTVSTFDTYLMRQMAVKPTLRWFTSWTSSHMEVFLFTGSCLYKPVFHYLKIPDWSSLGWIRLILAHCSEVQNPVAPLPWCLLRADSDGEWVWRNSHMMRQEAELSLNSHLLWSTAFWEKRQVA